MNNDSFYVTLPSNSSMEYFPNNTMSEYTTVLPQPIKLNGKFEVALTELNYSPYFSVPIGKIEIPTILFSLKYKDLLPIPANTITIEFNIINGISNEKFCAQLNDFITRYILNLDVDIRQKLAYGRMNDEILSRARLNNQVRISNDRLPDLLVIETLDQKNALYSNADEPIAPLYFVIDEEDSIYRNVYTECGGQYFAPGLKWKFNDSTELSKKFDTYLIKCEPLIINNNASKDESYEVKIKREAYLSYTNQLNKLIKNLEFEKDITFKFHSTFQNLKWIVLYQKLE